MKARSPSLERPRGASHEWNLGPSPPQVPPGNKLQGAERAQGPRRGAHGGVGHGLGGGEMLRPRETEARERPPADKNRASQPAVDGQSPFRTTYETLEC